jgi:KDO2-lipid IV(A) lauroyltransferase
MGRRKKSRFKQRVEYLAYRAAASVIARISEERAQRWGARLGSFARVVLRKRNRIALQNLALVFPDRDPQQLREVAKDCWCHFGRELLGYIRLREMPLDKIAERCDFVGVDLIKEGLARGNGVLIISAHFGGWEVAGLAVMAHVPNVRTLVRPLDNELLERDLVRLRGKTGVQVIDRRNAARPMTKALSENAPIVLLADQAVLPREGVLVPFLGRDAWTTPAPAKLALRHGSTIVIGFCIPVGTRHRVEFKDSIRVDELSEGERDAVELTKRINEIIARRIIESPELWFWMHDRWKGTPTAG